MDEREPEITVNFGVAGRGFDTELATRTIGRTPTKVWRQKHEHLKARTDLSDTSWIVEIDWTEMDSVDDAVRRVLEEVWPYREGILTFVEEYEVSVSVTVFVRIWSNRPLYELLPDTMSKLVALNATFSLDIYDYSDDEDDD